MRLCGVAIVLAVMLLMGPAGPRPAVAQLAIQVLPSETAASPVDPSGRPAVRTTQASPAPRPPMRKIRAKRPPTPNQPITVYDARIEAGDLRISGSLRKGGLVVVLDDDISVIADKRGRFTFRLPYMPPGCIATLKAGDDEREAVVANCGPTGQPGPAGPQGIAGLAGPQGVPGSRGETGPKGETGAKGDAGLKGETGAKGETGSQGAPGPRGEPGQRGASGPQGPAGPQGMTGAQGMAAGDGQPGAANPPAAAMPVAVAASPPASPGAFRVLRLETCPVGGCEITCDGAEVLVSAYCLKARSPTFMQSGGASTAACPADSQGMIGVCGRL